MKRKDKYMINMEWEQMNKDNMRIWVFKVIKVDLIILVDLVILVVSLVVKELKVLKIYLMVLKNLFLIIEVNLKVHKEVMILYYIWKLILWKLLMVLLELLILKLKIHVIYVMVINVNLVQNPQNVQLVKVVGLLILDKVLCKYKWVVILVMVKVLL